MLTIPIPISDTEYILFVALSDGNISRIKQYDPAEIIFSKFRDSEIVSTRSLNRVIIGYATVKEMAEIVGGKVTVGEWLKKINRGWNFRPELGDSDKDYEKV